jgi:hypothetical protein
VSAGVEVEGAANARAVLPIVDDGVYLHQTTIAAPDGSLRRFRDLPDALASGPDGIWRVHAHVPVDREPVAPLGTTKRHLEALLRSVRATHFEVETYTWNVLPSPLRGADLVEDIARELTWTRQLLEETP